MLVIFVLALMINNS